MKDTEKVTFTITLYEWAAHLSSWQKMMSPVNLRHIIHINFSLFFVCSWKTWFLVDDHIEIYECIIIDLIRKSRLRKSLSLINFDTLKDLVNTINQSSGDDRETMDLQVAFDTRQGSFLLRLSGVSESSPIKIPIPCARDLDISRVCKFDYESK